MSFTFRRTHIAQSAVSSTDGWTYSRVVGALIKVNYQGRMGTSGRGEHRFHMMLINEWMSRYCYHFQQHKCRRPRRQRAAAAAAASVAATKRPPGMRVYRPVGILWLGKWGSDLPSVCQLPIVLIWDVTARAKNCRPLGLRVSIQAHPAQPAPSCQNKQLSNSSQLKLKLRIASAAFPKENPSHHTDYSYHMKR